MNDGYLQEFVIQIFKSSFIVKLSILLFARLDFVYMHKKLCYFVASSACVFCLKRMRKLLLRGIISNDAHVRGGASTYILSLVCYGGKHSTQT